MAEVTGWIGFAGAWLVLVLLLCGGIIGGFWLIAQLMQHVRISVDAAQPGDPRAWGGVRWGSHVVVIGIGKQLEAR